MYTFFYTTKNQTALWITHSKRKMYNECEIYKSLFFIGYYFNLSKFWNVNNK